MSEDAAGTENAEPEATDDAATDEPESAPLDERLRALADRAADEEVAAEAEALADDAADLRATAADLRETATRVEDLEARLKRKQAEFQNYKKRQEREREKLRERATEAFVERVVTVRDDLVRALAQDEDADLREGLEGTLASFDEVLAEEGVEPIEPDAGEEVDPVRHEVLMREESDQPEGTVVTTYRPGYEMAGRVVQTAQVTVSEGVGDDE
ncbi:MAG: nucleotide exchange factor GrpE [Haloferacaceae archaeon]